MCDVSGAAGPGACGNATLARWSRGAGRMTGGPPLLQCPFFNPSKIYKLIRI
jgi:hypothetical protein